MKQHHYQVSVEWTGNEGKGTLNYRAYNRNHRISADGKLHDILAASDPSFLGDEARYNPEELFLSSLSTCHMLWYLHLCSINNIIVIHYNDQASGTMEEDQQGSGRFTSVTLYPQVQVQHPEMIAKANTLHEEANTMCFIANSCNFKISHQPTTTAA